PVSGERGVHDQGAGCAPRMSRRSTIALVLLTLSLAGCADRDEAISPTLTELHQRAVAGDDAAQLELGLHYVTGTGTGTGTPPDESAALRWIGKAATQGNAAAQFELGSYYTLEPHRNWPRAADLLRQSALQGFAPAQSSLAILYWAGKGVPQDRIEAYAWLGLATEQGEREALELQPGLQAELSDAELEQARNRALRYRQGAL
ncbi:MAG: tetratricopeptide repeat protein, partial [Candidatus Competibacteraceae bacterium]